MNKRKINIIIFTILTIIIRLVLFKIEEGDYSVFLSAWIKYMRTSGGIISLKDTFSDYNSPYLIILLLLSYIPIKPLYSIKVLSVIFEMFIALLSYKYIYKYIDSDKKCKKHKSIMTYMVILLLPTLILNSSAMCQCDSIYTFFALLSIYYLIDEKYIISFILLGVSFAFKLQFIFVLPVYVILFFCVRKVKLRYFLLIPLSNLILCLPAIIVGSSPMYTYNIYLYQTEEYGLGLSNNAVNIYYFFPEINIVKIIGIIFTLLLFLLLLICCYKKRIKWDSKSIITLSLLSVILCFYFLPCMHERYLYLADILSIIWFVIHKNKTNIFVPIFINLCSTIMYLITLFGIEKNNIIYIIYIFVNFMLIYCIIVVLRWLGETYE